MKTQAIIVREVHEKREQRDTDHTGVGAGLGSTYDTVVALLQQIRAYFDALPPSDLQKTQMTNVTFEAAVALQQMRDETASAIANQQQQINSLSQQLATTKTSTSQQLAAESSNVSPGAAAAIAVASAIGGGALGYFIRGKV